jgi:hypothetical protein
MSRFSSEKKDKKSVIFFLQTKDYFSFRAIMPRGDSAANVCLAHARWPLSGGLA